MSALLLSAVIVVLTTAMTRSLSVDLLNEKYISYLGRVDFTSNVPRFDWPGVSFKLNISSSIDTDTNGTVKITFTKTSGHKYVFQALADGVYDLGKYVLSDSTGFDISFSMPFSREYCTLSIVKLTEANYSTATGVVELTSISLSGLDIFPFYSSNQKVLFIGDSFTVGYGDDGVYPCTFTPETENILHSFPSLVSKSLNLDYTVVGWSGKGVVRNYGDSNQLSAFPMPFFYNRTIATEDKYWNPKYFIPDVVYVMLGTNDFSTNPTPTDSQFIDGLSTFIKRIMTDYPSSTIGVACSPSARLNQCDDIKQVAVSMSIDYLGISHSTLDPGYGCDNHPNLASQQNIADAITPFIKSLLLK